MKFKFIVYFLIFNFCSCAFIHHTPEGFSRNPAQILLGDNLTNANKIKILMAIHKEIPELFANANASRFDIDLLKIQKKHE